LFGNVSVLTYTKGTGFIFCEESKLMRTNSGDVTTLIETTEVQAEPDFLQFRGESTESIDIENLFTRDVTTSGSFDLRQVRNISFGKLLAALPLPTLLLDSSHQIVFCNHAMAEASSEATQEIRGSFESLFPAAVDMDRASSVLSQVLRERKTQAFEGMALIRGKLRWCRIHLRSIRFRKDRLVLAIIEDLTAEKKQLILSEKYQRLVQVFPIGIAEFALNESIFMHRPVEEILEAISDATLVGGNREFARIYGCRDIRELNGSRFADLLPFAEAYQLIYRMWIKGRFPVRSFETRHQPQEGPARFYENTLVGNIKSDHLHALWAMRQDVTHRKETEEALRAARDRLEERVRERTAELLMANERMILEIAEREKAEQELEKLVVELQQALAEVKTLSGLLPICASCKKIRDDQGYWTQVEVYVRDHSDAEFTHSICPECAKRLYPDLFGRHTGER
jgi:PAS domain-containing protein